MQYNNSVLNGLMLDDHQLFRSGLRQSLCSHLNVRFEEFGDGESLLHRISEASKQNDHLDFIITDINHPNLNGKEVIKRIRNLNDTVLFHNGLRLKHIPIIVVTMMNDEATKAEIRNISSKIIYLTKEVEAEELLKSVVKSISVYRKEIIEEFTNQGYTIQFEDGKFRLNKTFELPPFIETKFFEGLAPAASKATTRKILIQNTPSFSKISIRMLEDLLNDNRAKERDLHEFFLLFPEFLLGGNYDIAYSENSFTSSKEKLRTDIVTHPRGMRDEADQWTIFELKRHTEQILTNKKYHANFSKAVYNAITQLKNYQEYFNNPANEQDIRNTYAGILPKPKLALIIGRKPTDKDLFIKMKSRFPEISITTYDEILTFRKIQVEYLESMGF